ncbi:MAG: bifunctional UDP-N-acetylglucosamine diphosphorylase/glucosamine-1-phosphate N-acetyltransferase GlmU [Gammaproteobacteria bacterium]
MTLHVIVLAAGKGTRMRSTLPKVLHPLAGRAMLEHVVSTAEQLSPDHIHVVVGHGAQAIREAVSGSPSLHWVEQVSQLGTAHAVMQAMPHVPDGACVLVLYGDVPLIKLATLQRLVREAQSGHLGLLTAHLDNPTGYGRILRDEQGEVRLIVEEADATDEQRRIGEVNTGFMAASAEELKGWLDGIQNQNAQGEYYLTDVVAQAVASNTPVASVICSDPTEVVGVNSRSELAKAERIFQRRQADRLMEAGLTIEDPARFDLRGRLTCGQDCRVDINVVIGGDVELGDHVSIGPNCQITDSVLGDHVEIRANSVVEGARIAHHCSVGPFARVRPGTDLAEHARIGNFVETKNAVIGADSKANHLAYVGDAHVGDRVNIGAGVITCNYDGANKHQTTIEDDAFIGSNSALVAPVTVGKGATVGAGSAINRDVAPGQLVVTRADQTVREDWQRPEKKSKKGENAQ